MWNPLSFYKKNQKSLRNQNRWRIISTWQHKLKGRFCPFQLPQLLALHTCTHEELDTFHYKASLHILPLALLQEIVRPTQPHNIVCCLLLKNCSNICLRTFLTVNLYSLLAESPQHWCLVCLFYLPFSRPCYFFHFSFPIPRQFRRSILYFTR